MQIYGSLSEEKKQALDVLMAQADGDLVISTEILLKDAERGKLRQELLKQKEDGLIILPWYCKVAIPTEHWIYLDECANEGIYCSECHKKIYTLDFAKKVKVKFCPNCGAKMVEPQESEDKE